MGVEGPNLEMLIPRLGDDDDEQESGDDKPVRTPAALVDFGKAIGRDMPASLKRTRQIAAKIRAVSNTPPAKKGAR